MCVVIVRNVSKNETGINGFDQPRYKKRGSPYDVNCLTKCVRSLFSGLLSEIYDNML